jgi:hypothetical protein
MAAALEIEGGFGKEALDEHFFGLGFYGGALLRHRGAPCCVGGIIAKAGEGRKGCLGC